ncbi:hypothetical protein ACFVW9_15165 [Streptomyces sp. NPDC058217]|uniref:hypothetical protein n=1 Tax=Streptomyces sp. NPDC058217 TaxID=3346384 RepID=UPI0036E0DFB0
MALTDVMARHREITAHAIAHNVTTDPETHPELLLQLNRIWRKEAVSHTDEDRIWLQAVANLSSEVHTALYRAARAAEQHSAARCLAHHRTSTPTAA